MPSRLTVVVLVVALWALLVAEIRERPPVAIDEPHWITSGYLTWELVTGLAGPGRWEGAYEERGLGAWGHANPPLGKLAIGALVAAARQPSDSIDYRWSFALDYAGNEREGNLPPADLLVPVRIGISVFAAFALGLAYCCALQVTGARWLSLVAPLALFLSPVFRFHAARVYTDVPQLCLLLAAVVAFNLHLLRGSRRALYAALVLAGLATAVKFSAGALVLAMGVFALWRRAAPRRRLLDAALVAIVPLAVFTLVNPYLYPNPPGRTLEIAGEWSGIMAGAAADARLAGSAVDSPARGLALAARRAVLAPWFGHPALAGFEFALAPAIGLVALALVAALFRYRVRPAAPPGDPRGLVVLAVCALVGALRLLAGLSLAAALFVFGLWRLAGGGLDAGRARVDPEPRRFLLLLFTVTFVLTGLWLPFDWQRYYLRLIALLPAFYAAGVALLAGTFALERRRGADMRTSDSDLCPLGDGFAAGAREARSVARWRGR